jgi:hypothetical protein
MQQAAMKLYGDILMSDVDLRKRPATRIALVMRYTGLHTFSWCSNGSVPAASAQVGSGTFNSMDFSSTAYGPMGIFGLGTWQYSCEVNEVRWYDSALSDSMMLSVLAEVEAKWPRITPTY